MYRQKKVKNGELPMFELYFRKARTAFEAEWKDGVARLVKIAAVTREKQNLKVVAGVECTVVKPREDGEEQKRYMRTPCPSLCISRML